MESGMSTQEQQLCQFLMGLPAQHKYRYTDNAQHQLLNNLFWCMAAGKSEYMNLLFPTGGPLRNGTLKLKEAQGAVDGAEYTEAARGKACGHIFKPGEASYSCRTCSADDTCCLCSRCFDSTDHTGHMVRISISLGNTGCCDCGDPEAWKLPMFCTIHSHWDGDHDKGKGRAAAGLPEDLIANIRMTIGRVFDFLCDVISCSPEQLRQAKTVQTIQQDEKLSRLSATYDGGDVDSPEEYAVLLWNDEKHTVQDVRDQVARACSVTKSVGLEKAYETDAVGRSLLKHSNSIEDLLQVAKILEQIKVTVTIRSSRDTFREQMCGTMIEWLSDISGCSVGSDHHILRRIVCEEMLKPWSQGSPASHAIVGENGIDDEELLESKAEEERHHVFLAHHRVLLQARRAIQTAAMEQMDTDDDDDDNDDAWEGNRTPSSDGEEDEDDVDEDDDDVLMVDTQPEATGDDVNMTDWRAQGTDQQTLEESEATIAGYPPPPPPPPVPARRSTREQRDLTPSDSDTAEPLIAPTVYAKANLDVPKTPGNAQDPKTSPPRPGRYWLGSPAAYTECTNVPTAEDLFKRVRLDWMILFDLRMWKKVRNDLRSLYISTVVTIPEFKRVLGLRFAGLYTTLAQLYLIGDREPDHSIINISLQMLTTPSITAEIVERGNFLTSLMAILYTFLTTRQVGHPWDVSSNAVLAFDSGSVTNRRMYHFFIDLRYLFGSPHVQEKLRTEDRYLMQFLDLVKLHQGICPNTRAIGDHVEYETDTWISASLITREINRLCRQVSESFQPTKEQDSSYVSRAIRLAAKSVIVNSIGAERSRFAQAEIKDEVKFKTLNDFEFDLDFASYDVVKFVVEEQSISFHHALHYTLSWLIECGKSMSREELRALLTFTTQDLKMRPRAMGKKAMPKRDYLPEDYLIAAFDYPLRVCAWLAQMKAGMWVRNGISLRHQAGTYRGVNQRDVSHHRDIFLLQTALVVCNPSRVLASIIDRFSMEKWVKGIFEQKAAGQDDIQHLDVVEDMIHLLIVLISDRTSLMETKDNTTAQMFQMRRDITHVLCFRPLSFSEISQKLPEKYQESETFHTVLEEMSNYKAPDGISDVGTFELKPEFIEDVDPYIAHYNKNQREESETAYRKWMAKRTGKVVDDIVYEPKLRPIASGAFTALSEFTSTGMFAQLIYYSLLYPLVAQKLTPNVQYTRVETFLQVVLHLVILAISEDRATEDSGSEPSFVHLSLSQVARSNFMPDAPNAKTIVALLDMISTKPELKACHPKVFVILKRMRQKRPREFESAYLRLGIPVDRISTASPANSSSIEEEREKKKKAALDRQARVMAQFQQQQKSFMANQGDIDWGVVEDEDEEIPEPMMDQKNFWKYPAGTCILCQEETDDRRLYGTFAFFTESHILRQTDFQDPDFTREVLNVPKNLDRSAEAIRPFGIAHENRRQVAKINAAGETFTTERQGIGKGFPSDNCKPGPLSTGCGHIMHYHCFEQYYDATVRRHQHQIARHHPEDTDRTEFVCPLCKALGNAFLPIVWKGKEESYPGVLRLASPLPTDMLFNDFLDSQAEKIRMDSAAPPAEWLQSGLGNYTSTWMLNNVSDSAQYRADEVWESDARASAGTPMSEDFPTPGSSVRSLAIPETAPSMARDLVAVYRRLRDTLRKNGLESRHKMDEDADDLCSSDILARSIGYSISAVEIQQRGTDAEYGMTLVEKIPDQVLTHLRVLAETVTSYLAVGGQRYAGKGQIMREFRSEVERQQLQLFVGWKMGVMLDGPHQHIPLSLEVNAPLMSQDTFIFLTECISGFGAAHQVEPVHLVRLCYLAEIAKVVYHIGRNHDINQWISVLVNRDHNNPELDHFARFCLEILTLHLQARRGADVGLEELARPTEDFSLPGDKQGFNQEGFSTLESFLLFVKRYALVFLRKTAVLLYVQFGVDLNSHVSISPELDELDRLTATLRVPTFDEMLGSLTGQPSTCEWPDTDKMKNIVGGWILHDLLHDEMRSGSAKRDEDERPPRSAQLSHPGIFELVGLPKNYDQLIEECTRRRCPTTGKDLTDPMICLMCGEIFCGQGICCLKEEKSVRGRTPKRIGGAQQHMRNRCQRSTGLFINIRKCCVLYFNRYSGSFSNAPYIDKYGEVDLGLRHFRQLFLHQKRYDAMLRAMWLGHGIPSYISRKLEADINNGGWETI